MSHKEWRFVGFTGEVKWILAGIVRLLDSSFQCVLKTPCTPYSDDSVDVSAVALPHPHQQILRHRNWKCWAALVWTCPPTFNMKRASCQSGRWKIRIHRMALWDKRRIHERAGSPFSLFVVACALLEPTNSNSFFVRNLFFPYSF